MALLVASWAEEKEGICIPRISTPAPGASTKEHSAAHEAEAHSFMSHATWVDAMFLVGSCTADLGALTTQTIMALGGKCLAIQEDKIISAGLQG